MERDNQKIKLKPVDKGDLIGVFITINKKENLLRRIK